MTVDTRTAAQTGPEHLGHPFLDDTGLDDAGSTDLRRAASGLPRTDHLALPSRRLLRALVRPARAVLRTLWNIEVHGSEHVPAGGPVILACNHIATMDGPLAVVMSPRFPTYALAKSELFVGPVGEVLQGSGQIPIDRDVVVDRAAIDRCIRVLRAGQALAIFPEGMRDTGEFRWIRPGAAYLAMVTGAPIVPTALLGTRRAGDSPRSTPRPGSRMHVVFGAPLHLPWVDWPRRRVDVAQASERLRIQLAAHVRHAEAMTGMPLPGVPKDRIAAF